MLYQYMLVLTNTGIRIGEARMPKWRDIESQERLVNDKKVKDIVFRVKRKTNARDVVARSDAVAEYLSRIYEMRTEELVKTPLIDE